MLCEICGERKANSNSKIDGTNFRVCENCNRFGKVIHKPAPLKKSGSSFIEVKTELEILPDFPKRIRSAREASGLNRKEFAQRLNEKVGVIEQIESGKRLPNVQVAKKIERHFNIQLIGSVVETETQTSSLPKMTLGDQVVMKTKGRK
ncbi:MAG: TIGR00270 family protein [Candidatus Altiarchaeota archaeon]|nr:TIGR00270 family protein [Candidatus Altiarchaeota archaeon]